MSFAGLFDNGRSNSAVRRLLAWKQGEEDDTWAVKAIDALVKKLKNRKGAMEDLDRALEIRTEATKCVTIPRSQDGRLQVSHRKGLPHVIYCRVWRWPDLQSHHELRALPTCENSFENNANKDVCINPYHYQRIETPVLPPVLVPRHCEFHSNHMMAPFHPMRRDEPDDCMPNNFTLDEQHSPNMNNNRQVFSPMNGMGSPFNRYPLSPNPGSPRSFAMPPRHPLDDDMDMAETGMNQLHIAKDDAVAIVDLVEHDMWCSIQYFELNTRVGEPFRAPKHTGPSGIDIDGFTDPTINGRRFSLGQLSNIHRNSTIENTRKHIGQGVFLNYVGGYVSARCLSTSSIFIQSREYNIRNNLHATSILKLTHGKQQSIFSTQDFAQTLRDRAQTVYPTREFPSAYEAVFDLQKMCVIRMSFVKGWGADYNRQDVVSTPCWIEIHLHGPMFWLDKVLTQLPPPPSLLQSDT